MKQMSQRKAYGEALVQLGENDERIVVLEADLGKSTMSCLFEKRFPERFFEMGISEANLVSAAAGLSLYGKIPFCNSFAVFLTGRAYDQIRQSICIAGLHVILVGSSAGFSDFGDGSTHQTIEDIATMRALPNMMVLSPSDPVEAQKMVAALVDRKGPAYMRICRSDMPILLDEDEPYELGKMIEIKKNGDIAIFATGYMVSIALQAAEILQQKEGISARVINVGCIKPLDTETLYKVAGDVKGIVTVEEHSVIGGLGSAILEALANRYTLPVDVIGVKDSFGCSAHSHQELLDHYGLTALNIVNAVRKMHVN